MDKEGYFHKLNHTLDLFANAVGIGTTLLDLDGNVVEHFGHICAYCSMFRQNDLLCERCNGYHTEAGEQAARFGECYYFYCYNALACASIALYRSGRYVCSVLIGPVLLEYPDTDTMNDIIEYGDMNQASRALLYQYLEDIPVLTPERFYYTGELLSQLMSNYMDDRQRQLVTKTRAQNRQNRQISWAYQQQKKHPAARTLQESKELELTSLMEEGNLENAQILLNDLLGNIYFSSGNNLELIKIRVTELITVVSRRLYRSGYTDESFFDLVNEFQKKTASYKDADDLSYDLSLLLEQMIDLIREHVYPKSGYQVKKCLEYIHRNYRDNVTLEDAAAYSSTSPTYLSRLFKAETGVGFSAYINHLRLKKSKELLLDTTLSLAEISTECGYSSQQYFTKVFKKETGMTPANYRNAVSRTHDSDREQHLPSVHPIL
jgi:two-component system response regulator YesN